jgi:hypothetical protein
VSGKDGKDGKGGKAVEKEAVEKEAVEKEANRTQAEEFRRSYRPFTYRLFSYRPFDGGAGNRTLVRVSFQNRVYVCRLDSLPSLRSGIEPTSPKPIS